MYDAVLLCFASEEQIFWNIFFHGRSNLFLRITSEHFSNYVTFFQILFQLLFQLVENSGPQTFFMYVNEKKALHRLFF